MSLLRRSRPDRPLSCREVGKILQSYLDRHTDEATATRVAEHLEHCRRCGLEAEVYEDIKASLGRQAEPIPADVLARLREVAERLVAGGDAGA